MNDSSGNKLEATARLVQWKIENMASCSFRRSDSFKVGLWNWHLSVEKSRYLYVRLFPELCRISKELPPIATFVLRIVNATSSRRPWISPVYDGKLLRTSEDFVCPVDTTFHGRFIIDVEFLDLKIASTHGGEAESIWPNRVVVMQAQERVFSCLSRMLDDQILTDVTIRTGTGSIGAHRAILAARSPIFKKMFANKDSRETPPLSIIEMGSISLDACQAFLSFIYGNIKVEEFYLHRVALLEASDMYDIQDLKKACEDSLLEDIDTKNVLERLQAAWLYHLDRLKRGCLRYLMGFGKIYDVREDLRRFLQIADRDLILEMYQESLDAFKAF